jgi:hypothetical protein
MIFNRYKYKYEIKLDKLFRFDKKANAYIIDIFIKDYESLYSDLDFSPLKNKDLNDEFIDHLENSIEDIPFKYNLLININMPENLYDEIKEKRGIKEIKNYFLYLYRKKIREIHAVYKSAIISFILGILLIFTVSIIKKKISVTQLIWEIVIEGFNIGGWVFLWEFFSLLFLEPNKEKIKIKQYQRILDSQIRYTYHK